MSPVAVMEGSKPDLELESELHRIIIKKKKKNKVNTCGSSDREKQHLHLYSSPAGEPMPPKGMAPVI